MNKFVKWTLICAGGLLAFVLAVILALYIMFTYVLTPTELAEQPYYAPPQAVQEQLAPLNDRNKSLGDRFVEEPIQRQLERDLSNDCVQQLEYYEGEQRRGDDDPFIEYRVEQLKDRCN